MYPPFTPGPTAVISASTTSARVPLPLGRQMRVRNFGADNVFIRFGTSAVDAALTDMPIGVGESIMLTRPEGATHVAAICGTSTAVVYFTGGAGV